MKPTEYEMAAITEMFKILGNKYTLQPKLFAENIASTTYKFDLSNGDEYIVQVFDKEKTKIYKILSNENNTGN